MVNKLQLFGLFAISLMYVWDKVVKAALLLNSSEKTACINHNKHTFSLKIPYISRHLYFCSLLCTAARASCPASVVRTLAYMT